MNIFEPMQPVRLDTSRKAEILARLEAIDALADKPRTRRELALGKAATKTWLQTLDTEAATLRAELGAL